MNTPILPETVPEPRNIRVYLSTHGWQREPSEPTVWMLPTSRGGFEVIAPSTPRNRDFRARIAELLRTVSVAEGRSPDEVLNDLFTLRYDIQYIHEEHDGPPGTAPLRDAATLYSAAQNMMASVSASLEEPRSVLSGRRSSRSSEVMRKVLAGPTGAGSYIVSIWTPILPRMTPEDDGVLFEWDWDNEPVERKTTALLQTALTSTRAAVDRVLNENEGVSTFIDRAAEGVSANLCESIVGIAGEEKTPFDVRFAWALDRPMQSPQDPIHFDRPSFEVLSDAAREMRNQLPEGEVRLRGNVIRLHRETTGLGSGEITVTGIISGDPVARLRKVWVSLSESDYQLAIRAHEAMTDIDLSGTLGQRGNRTYLRLSAPFTALPELNET